MLYLTLTVNIIKRTLSIRLRARSLRRPMLTYHRQTVICKVLRISISLVMLNSGWTE